MSSLWMTSFTVSPSRRQPVRHPLRHLLRRLIRSAPRLTRISAKMEGGRASIRQEHSKIRATASSLSKLVSDRNSLHFDHVFCRCAVIRRGPAPYRLVESPWPSRHDQRKVLGREEHQDASAEP